MTKELIFFDIDGTLLNDRQQIPESTKSAIRMLQNKGHYVIIATGRAPYMFREIREELGIDSYVCFNGQLAVLDNKIVYEKTIDRTAVEGLTKLANEKNHPLLYMTIDEMKSNYEYHEHIEKSLKTLGINHPSFNMNIYKEKDTFQILLFCDHEVETDYFHFNQLDFIRWHPFSLDVLPKGGSKARGIERIVNLQGYKKQNVYAFGDNLNDIEMLRYVGHGVAMGNAPDSVKNAARYVTADVDDGGILKGLQLVGLL